MHSMKHEAHASAKAKMSRMAGSRGVSHTGEASTPDIGDGVEESYGNVAAGPSSSARFARGGHVEGDPAMRRLDRKPRGKFAHGGAVKGKGKTIVNINVGSPQGQQAMPVPVPVPVPAGGPPPGAQMPPPRPPMMGPQGMPPGAMPPAGAVPPGAVPPGMIPGRARGGRTYGGAFTDDDHYPEGEKRGGKVKRAEGGRIPKTGGAASGVGRAEKAGLKVGAR